MPIAEDKSTSMFLRIAMSKSSGVHSPKNLNSAHSGVNAGGEGFLTTV